MSLVPSSDRRTGRPTREQAAGIGLAVLDGARRAFLEHGPGASMDDVAALAGVSKLTVYRRFPSKDDLLLAVLDQDIERLAARLDLALQAEREPMERLRGVTKALFDFTTHPDNVRMTRMFVRDLYVNANLIARVEHWRATIEARIDPCMEAAFERGILSTIDPLTARDILIELMIVQGERLRYAELDPSRPELDAIFEARWTFFLRGVGAR